jgi:chaperonin GroEL (HSP60 family)
MLPGGGVAYIRIMDKLTNIECENDDQLHGIKIVLKLRTPTRLLAVLKLSKITKIQTINNLLKVGIRNMFRRDRWMS